jgi:hypothetical protein
MMYMGAARSFSLEGDQFSRSNSQKFCPSALRIEDYIISKNYL